MILGTVDAFIDKIPQAYYDTKQSILSTTRLIGYGMLCTGFAFYKLMIDFDEEEMLFTTKVKPAIRPFCGVVEHMDYCVEYFMSKRT